MKNTFLKFMYNIMKNYMNFILIYHFYQKDKIEKVEKLKANLHDKTEYNIHIRNLKPALNHELFLKKFHRVIKFNQNAFLKWKQISEKKNNNFGKDFFKLMDNAVFGKLWKMWENIKILNLLRQKKKELFRTFNTRIK